MVGQSGASNQYGRMNGDAELDSNATIDLTVGAVGLDEIQGFPEGKILVGVDGTAAANHLVSLNGDATMSATGAVTIMPNRVDLSKIGRSPEPGQLIVGQGRRSDLMFKTITGDASLSNGGVRSLSLVLRPPRGDLAVARNDVPSVHCWWLGLDGLCCNRCSR